MRALKIAGVVLVGLWMAWVTYRIEMVATHADFACKLAYFREKADEAPYGCYGMMLRAPLVERVRIPAENSN